MLKRGRYIGEIIDSLASLQQTVEFRTELGLTDLNKVCEDFFSLVNNVHFVFFLWFCQFSKQIGD